MAPFPLRLFCSVVTALALCLLAPRTAHADGETPPAQLDEPLTDEDSPLVDEAAPHTLWTPAVRHLLLLILGPGVAADAAFLVGGSVVGLAYYGLTGLATLVLMRQDPTGFVWYWACGAWMFSFVAVAVGAFVSYAGARLAVPYAVPAPGRDMSPARRTRLAAIFNGVDVLLHLGAVVVAGATTAAVAAGLAALWLVSAWIANLLIPVPPGSFGPNPGMYVLYGGLIAWAVGGVPGAATFFLAALLPALVLVHTITPVVAMTLDERLAARGSGENETSVTPAEGH